MVTPPLKLTVALVSTAASNTAHPVAPQDRAQRNLDATGDDPRADPQEGLVRKHLGAAMSYRQHAATESSW